MLIILILFSMQIYILFKITIKWNGNIVITIRIESFFLSKQRCEMTRRLRVFGATQNRIFCFHIFACSLQREFCRFPRKLLTPPFCAFAPYIELKTWRYILSLDPKPIVKWIGIVSWLGQGISNDYYDVPKGRYNSNIYDIFFLILPSSNLNLFFTPGNSDV